MSKPTKETATAPLAGAAGSARVCPKCGTRAHADRCMICTDETRLVEEVPCPFCYGGHFRPCQPCGDSGVAWREVSLNATRSATPEDAR